MADKPNQFILEALSKAVAEPAGLPLHAGKGFQGLFSSTAPGKQAAQLCKEEGLLVSVRTENRGKASYEICVLSEKGLAYLLKEVSPKQAIEAFVLALSTRQAQADDLLKIAHATQADVSALKERAERVFAELFKPTVHPERGASANGSHTWLASILSHLAQRQTAATSEDCPLPDLYRLTQKVAPALTVGTFHDGLRRLHAEEQIYLHPWTGPLYDIPEPVYALLVGHEIAYYASLRLRITPAEGLNAQ